METLRDRLRQYLAYKHISVHKAEQLCHLANGTLRKPYENLSPTTTQSLLTAFPDLNTDWLFNGHGSMLSTQQTIILRQQQLIESLRKEIQELKKKK